MPLYVMRHMNWPGFSGFVRGWYFQWIAQVFFREIIFEIISIKMSSFQRKYFLLILKVFISFTKQFFTLHSNIVECEKQILEVSGVNVNSRSVLESLPYAKSFLAGAFVEKYFQSICIIASVLFVLYREALVV